ncbi:unnamed protein product, partial [Amoebophrya sp. A120]
KGFEASSGTDLRKNRAATTYAPALAQTCGEGILQQLVATKSFPHKFSLGEQASLLHSCSTLQLRNTSDLLFATDLDLSKILVHVWH